MTSEDASRPTEADRPKIAEKVKFWEEQDRINQELIPRVLKQHELLTSHIEKHESLSGTLATLEARKLESIRSENRQSSQQLMEKLASLEAGRDEAISLAKQESAEEAANKIVFLEERMAAAIKSTRRLAVVVSGASLAVAVVAVLLALVV